MKIDVKCEIKKKYLNLNKVSRDLKKNYKMKITLILFIFMLSLKLLMVRAGMSSIWSRIPDKKSLAFMAKEKIIAVNTLSH